MTDRIARTALLAAVGIGAAAGIAPAAADAAPNWRCTASPLTGSLLGQALPLPTAGDPSAECANDEATLPALGLPAPLDSLLKVNLLNGSTAASADGVFAAAGLANVNVGSLPIPIPAIPIPDSLKTITVSLPLGVAGAQIPVATVDLTPAIQALQSLPSKNLLGAQALYSQVTGSCVAGKPSVTGASRVLGAQVLGLDVDASKTVDTAVNLVDTTNIALNTLNLQLAKVTLLGGVVNVNTGDVLNALGPILQNLPPIQIPAQVAQVKLTPSSTEVVNGVTIQRALRAQISLAGQSIADLSIGQAAVGVGDVDCAPAASAPAAALECTKRKLTLIDVVPQGDRVRLYGAADKSLAGKTVRIRFQATGKEVAKTKIRKDGGFTTTAPMPAANLRNTNRARYIARAGGEKSLNLKLARRMVVESVTSKGGKVTIKGRVVQPLASPVQKITLKRRVTCKRYETVKSFMPSKSGRFTVTTKSPASGAATVYRLQTRVRKSTTNPKTYPTFTLPRAVDL